MTEREIKSVIVEICSKALEGKIKLDNFYEVWPKKALNVPLYDQIYGDLEDGIEHTPGYFLKQGVDHTAWIDTDAYLRIYLDSVLLGCDKSVDELLQCRTFVLQQKNLSQEIVRNSVKEYFNRLIADTT